MYIYQGRPPEARTRGRRGLDGQPHDDNIDIKTTSCNAYY